VRVLLACVLAAVLTAAPADAHRTTSRVHVMRDLAVDLYGPDVCGDTMTVPIVRGPMLNANWLAYSHHEGDEKPFTGCLIVLKDTHWDTEYLCRVIEHEYSHLDDYRAPEGKEYIRPDGTPDYSHSNDPLDLMWPFTIQSFAPCADGATDALPRSISSRAD
jgi:hypothetical protein